MSKCTSTLWTSSQKNLVKIFNYNCNANTVEVAFEGREETRV